MLTWTVLVPAMLLAQLATPESGLRGDHLLGAKATRRQQMQAIANQGNIGKAVLARHGLLRLGPGPLIRRAELIAKMAAGIGSQGRSHKCSEALIADVVSYAKLGKVDVGVGVASIDAALTLLTARERAEMGTILSRAAQAEAEDAPPRHDTEAYDLEPAARRLLSEVPNLTEVIAKQDHPTSCKALSALLARYPALPRDAQLLVALLIAPDN